MGLGPANDPVPQFLIADLEDGPNQSTGLTGRFDVGDVLEAALHLGPFATLWTVGAGQIVLERQVLQRQQEDGQARALPRLRKLLQQIGIGIAAASNRFEVLAELVDNQQKRCVLSQTPGDIDDRGCGRSGSAGIVRCGVFERFSQRLGGPESTGRWELAVAAEDRGMEPPEHRVAKRLTVGGNQTAMESGIRGPVAVVGLSNRLAHRG